MLRTARPRTLVTAIASLAMVVAMVGAAPPPEEGTTASLPLPPTTVDPALAATLLDADGAPLEAAAVAVVTTHDRDGLAAVEAAGVTGATLTTLPMVLVEDLTGQQLQSLRALDEVRSVWAQEEFELHMQESTWVTRAREVWALEDEGVGYTGEGIELGVVDTGADGTHYDYDNLIEFCNASATGTIGLVLCTENRELAVDDNGHGTHVAGTMAGTGEASGGRAEPHSTTGMAPDAQIRSYAANVAASLLNTDILAAYDDLITKRIEGDNEIVAINNSFGGGIGGDYNPDDPQQIAYRTANEAGMLPVFSAGNSGPADNTLGTQCLNPWVLCVGASTKTDGITAFSSVGRPAAPQPDLPEDPDEEGTGEDPEDPEEADETEEPDEDIEYDNHDRRLARAFDIGVYRPGIVAPGAVINAMSANAPACRMGMPAPTGCYEELQGTSMSAPHVTGAAGLVAEAFEDIHDRLPTADELLDILERSAITLPGHPAEQQGNGRLDVAAAIEVVRTYRADGQSEPNWVAVGTPAPNYVAGKHPGGDTLLAEQVGCTGAGSFSVTDEGGVTTFDVPAGVQDLTVNVDWGAYHPDANLYLELFRPGHDPANSSDDPGPTRTYPVAESAGLIHTDPIIDDVGPPRTERSVTFAAPEDGTWSLRVLHRLGGTLQPCQDNDNTEETERAEGFSYDVEVHTTEVTDLPATSFTAGAADGDEVTLVGTGRYPAPFEGVTTWNAPRTQVDAGGDEEVAIAETLYFEGGPGDSISSEGSFGTEEPTGEPPATQTAELSAANDDVPWNPLAITWHGEYSGSIDGDLQFDWYWGSPNPTGQLIGVEAMVTVFADPDPEAEGEQPDKVVARQEVRFNVGPGEVGPVQNQNTVYVRGTFEESLQIQVRPVFIDTGPGVTAFYGSESTPSQVGIPESRAGDELADVAAPQNVRVTDLRNQLRVAWDPVDGATTYEVHRSTDPGFTPGEDTRIATTGGAACSAPNVPSWPGASREGRCFTDTSVVDDRTYYYRVAAVDDGVAGEASLLGYGTPTFPDRQARVQVDRIFGPGYWEDAEAADRRVRDWAHVWDRRGVDDPDEPRARVFSQGVGSLVATASEDPVVPGDRAPGEPRTTDRVCLEAGAYDNPYSDVTSDIVHYRNILCITDHGIAQGFTDGTYRPLRHITRDQMATFIANMIELERPLPPPRPRFTDVGPESPHWETIHQLAEAGVVHGRTTTSYAPRARVTRDQMASFIARAIDYIDTGEVDGSAPPPPSDSARFGDVPRDNPHRDAIHSLRDQGITVGFDDGRYGPREHTRRDQMASFIMRAYDYVAERGNG